MSWSTTSRASHGDYPALLAGNALEGTGYTRRWTTTGTMTGTDVTDADHPARFAVDGHYHLDTRPTGTNTGWYLNLQVDPLAAPDSFLIFGHNFGDISGGVSCVLSTADSDDWLTNPQDIHDFGTITDNVRLVHLSSSVWTGLTRARLKLSASVNFIPQVCEVVFATRYVLEHYPKIPRDESALVSDVSTQVTKSGAVVTYERSVGQRVDPFVLQLQTTTEIATVRAAFKAARYGSKRIILIEQPNTVPGAAHVMKIDPSLTLQRLGPFEREGSIPMTEVAPFYEIETA